DEPEKVPAAECSRGQAAGVRDRDQVGDRRRLDVGQTPGGLRDLLRQHVFRRTRELPDPDRGHPVSSTKRDRSASRKSRSPTSTPSAAACAPPPRGPSPSSVGTPAEAVRLPSEAPPTRTAPISPPRSPAIARIRS